MTTREQVEAVDRLIEAAKEAQSYRFWAYSEKADEALARARAEVLRMLAPAEPAPQVPEELRKLSEAADQCRCVIWPNTPFFLRGDTKNGWGILSTFHREKEQAEANARFSAACWNFVRDLIAKE